MFCGVELATHNLKLQGSLFPAIQLQGIMPNPHHVTLEWVEGAAPIAAGREFRQLLSRIPEGWGGGTIEGFEAYCQAPKNLSARISFLAWQ